MVVPTHGQWWSNLSTQSCSPSSGARAGLVEVARVVPLHRHGLAVRKCLLLVPRADAAVRRRGRARQARRDPGSVPAESRLPTHHSGQRMAIARMATLYAFATSGTTSALKMIEGTSTIAAVPARLRGEGPVMHRPSQKNLCGIRKRDARGRGSGKRAESDPASRAWEGSFANESTRRERIAGWEDARRFPPTSCRWGARSPWAGRGLGEWATR